MKIELYFPTESIADIRQFYSNQTSSETLRWTTHHPLSSYCQGVMIRGKSREVLDGMSFTIMVRFLNAWIETDSEEISSKVRSAIVTEVTTGTVESIKVTNT